MISRLRFPLMITPQHIRIEGHVSAGFEAVRDAFAENFSQRHELGGACCVYHRGEKIIGLWGGVRNKAAGEIDQAIGKTMGVRSGQAHSSNQQRCDRRSAIFQGRTSPT